MIALLSTLALTLPTALPPEPAPQGRANRAQPAAQNPGGAGPGGQEVSDFPIQEEGDYYILNFAEEASDGLNLEQFVKICAQATGRHFTYLDDTAAQLQQKQIRMFGLKRIPKRDFYSFFQIMMFIHEFVCIEVGPGPLSVIVIQSLAINTTRQNIKQRAQYVLPDELEDYADQPATLIITVLHLPNVDVRQLPTTLRPLTSDQATQTMVSVGNTNSLILTGFGSQVAAMAKLLYIVDRESASDDQQGPVFDVIKLEFASAEEVAELVNQLFEARERASQTIQRNQRQVAADGGTTNSRGLVEGAELLVDVRTNSLIAVAMPDDLPHIKELIARLDVEVVEPERNYHIYSLENVTAQDIADTLDDFLSDANRILQSGTGTSGRPAGQTGSTSSSRSQNDVVVVPDPNTNSLLIAASKTRYQEVLDLLGQLDRRQDQVLIETALIELSGNDQFDIGTELGGTDFPQNPDDFGSFGLTDFGFTEIVPNADGFPTRLPRQGLGGGLAGILHMSDIGLNTSAMIRLFEQRDDTNILSVPSVLVNNNGSATVVTLDERPYTQVTAFGGAGGGQTQENFQGYQEAGITLQISPSISASRYLRLGIQLTVSNFGSGGSASIPPPRITRELQTSVNIPDGDTMIIGGIVSDDKRESRSQVPWVGDIPLIGYLFGSRSTSNARTTLYFFVTPHIMHDRDFADLAEFSYQKKLHAAEVIGLPRVQMVDPRFGLDQDKVDLSVFEIPVYRAPERGTVNSQSVGMNPIRRNELLREGQAGDEGSEQE